MKPKKTDTLDKRVTAVEKELTETLKIVSALADVIIQLTDTNKKGTTNARNKNKQAN